MYAQCHAILPENVPSLLPHSTSYRCYGKGDGRNWLTARYEKPSPIHSSSVSCSLDQRDWPRAGRDGRAKCSISNYQHVFFLPSLLNSCGLKILLLVAKRLGKGERRTNCRGLTLLYPDRVRIHISSRFVLCRVRGWLAFGCGVLIIEALSNEGAMAPK
jgi:hypothetical protein